MKNVAATAGRARPGRRGGRGFSWPSWAAVGVLLVGIVISAALGVMRRDSVTRQDRQSFQLTASDVTATLSTLLGRDADFVSTLRALLSIQPNLTATRFSNFYGAVAGQQRQVGAVGSAVVSLIRARDLTAFEARRDTDPTFQALLGKWLAPVRRGPQKRYCLLSAGAELMPLNGLMAGLVQQDWCQPTSVLGLSQGALLDIATDSGQTVAVPVDVPSVRTVFLETAVYAYGAPVGTVAERRAAVTGWVVSSFDIPAVVQAAMGANPGLSVQLYHANPEQRPVLVGQIGSGRAGRLRQSTRRSIGGNWTVTVRGGSLTEGLDGNQQGWLVFGMGTVITVLVMLLARSREHALDLVAQKTRELRHRALHDALTGLPNRVLALDRGEQMLARARRTETAVAALYVDLDGFKPVNDTYGHAAGDELLRGVAERLRRVVRESDTAARLAGDEFVVLLDTSQLEIGPELVADRILEALREPYELATAGGRRVSVTASVGIAVGRRESAEALLADADAAMYAAKAAGRDRRVLLESQASYT